MKIEIKGIDGKMGAFVYQELKDIYEIGECGDVLIDFTHASCAKDIIKEALVNHKKVISGTTNIDFSSLMMLKKLAIEHEASFIWVPNYSVGANVLNELITDLSKYFDTSSIIESHNLSKKDIPSGTSKEYASKLKCENVISIRTDSKKISHEIILENEGEKLIIIHEINNRTAFMNGIRKAIKEITERDFILAIGMDDFLDLLKNEL